MAELDSEKPAVKTRSDAYTGILAISFLAMVGATVLLYLDLQNYEGKTPPKDFKIDVPGARLSSDPKSGAPAAARPIKKEEPQPKDEPAPKDTDTKEKDGAKDKEPSKNGSRLPQKAKELPAKLPKESIELARPIGEPGETIVIPPVQRAQFVPLSGKNNEPAVRVEEPLRIPAEPPIKVEFPKTSPASAPQVKPIIPMNALDDPPPLPPKRFDPSEGK